MLDLIFAWVGLILMAILMVMMLVEVFVDACKNGEDEEDQQ